MGFELTILGSNSAIPSFNRHPTSQVLKHNERLYLIDCGEGTQMQLSAYEIKTHRINHIFISHLHGDHYFGLMGLISSMHLLGRTAELNVYGQPELEEIINLQLKASYTHLRFNLAYHSISADKESVIFEDDEIVVSTIILSHRIPCTGFLFKEKNKPRKLIKEVIESLSIPVSELNLIKEGADFVNDKGEVIKNDEITVPPSSPKSYAFCSDTICIESIIETIKGVDLLYHEATFMNDLHERAKETFHTTTIEAATIAKKAGVKRLVIGHFSSRYKFLEPLLAEARTVFENTDLALEGEKFVV